MERLLGYASHESLARVVDNNKARRSDLPNFRTAFQVPKHASTALRSPKGKGGVYTMEPNQGLQYLGHFLGGLKGLACFPHDTLDQESLGKQ